MVSTNNKRVGRALLKPLVLLIQLALVVSALSGCAIGGSSSELQTLKNPKLGKSIKQAYDEFSQSEPYVGMSIGILVDGKVAYFNYGNVEKGGKRVDENTLYEVASLSKVLAGTLLADATIRAQVSLNDSVQDYFDFDVPDDNGEEMTLVQLATHSSGLPRMPYNFIYGSNPYIDYKEEHLLQYLQKAALKHTPGKVYEYSNLGVGLLGYILSQIEDKPYEQLLKEAILEKLDMDSTAIFLNDELQQRKAKPHFKNGTPASEWDFDVLQACAGVKSSTRDLLRFMAANLGRLETDEQLTQAMQMARQTHFRAVNAEVGLGWQFANYDGLRCLAHDGLAGGYSSFMAIAPQRKIGVVVLSNNAGNVIPLGTELIKVIYRHRD